MESREREREIRGIETRRRLTAPTSNAEEGARAYLVDVLVGLDEVDAKFPEGRRRWIAKPVGYPGLHGVNVRGGLLRDPAGSPAARGTGTTAYRGRHGLLGHQAPVKGCTSGPRSPAH